MTNASPNHDMTKINQITGKILSAAIEVHKELGPGFLEDVYEECLSVEFEERGIQNIRQFVLPVYYKKKRTNKFYKVDFMVEDEVPVELKAVDAIAPIHKAVTINYLKMANKKVGILINFNVVRLVDGFHRFIV